MEFARLRYQRSRGHVWNWLPSNPVGGNAAATCHRRNPGRNMRMLVTWGCGSFIGWTARRSPNGGAVETNIHQTWSKVVWLGKADRLPNKKLSARSIQGTILQCADRKYKSEGHTNTPSQATTRTQHPPHYSLRYRLTPGFILIHLDRSLELGIPP